MPENKLRKKYRDKFRRKFGMKASELPFLESAEEYEKLFAKVKYAEELNKFGYLGYPDELELAEEQLEEFFNRHIKRVGNVAQEGYEGLARLRREYYNVEKPKRKRLLRNASDTAVEAIQKIVKYEEGTEQHEAALLVLHNILSGGEVMTMDEAYMYMANPFEDEIYE